MDRTLETSGFFSEAEGARGGRPPNLSGKRTEVFRISRGWYIPGQKWFLLMSTSCRCSFFMFFYKCKEEVEWKTWFKPSQR